MIPPVFWVAAAVVLVAMVIVWGLTAMVASLDGWDDTWPKALAWTAGVLILAVVVATPLHIAANNQTHEGTHVGYVTAVETGGILYKTTTVYIKTNLESTQEDAYCVEDVGLVETLRKHADDKTRIEVTFTTHFFWSEGCPMDGDSTIRSVRAVKA